MQIDLGIRRATVPFVPAQTLVIVVEMSLRSWLVGGLLPGVARQPLKKIAADEHGLLELIERWRLEAEAARS